MRPRMVAGNWKMNKTPAEASALARELLRGWNPDGGVLTVLCPPFTALAAVAAEIESSGLELGAQNAHWEPAGALTGEISAAMLAASGCRYVLLGHSERRQYFGETDETVGRRVRAARSAGLVPVVCVGETLEEREAGRVREVLERQLLGGLAGLEPAAFGRGLVLAYEPVWAIGTGRNASPDQAQEAHAFLRSVLAGRAGPDAAAGVPILYGGSVKAANAAELFARPDIDGGLIGGASLDAAPFLDIVRAAGDAPAHPPQEA